MKKIIVILFVFAFFSCSEDSIKNRILTGNVWILAEKDSYFKKSMRVLVLKFYSDHTVEIVKEKTDSVKVSWKWNVLNNDELNLGPIRFMNEELIIGANPYIPNSHHGLRIVQLDNNQINLFHITDTISMNRKRWIFVNANSTLWYSEFSDEHVVKANEINHESGKFEIDEKPIALPPKEAPKIDETTTKSYSSNPQEEFKKYLLDNTAVTDVQYESDWQIWVYLKPEKYTSVENVEQIAKQIAKWYGQRMNKDYTICTVWQGSQVYAKGNSN